MKYIDRTRIGMELFFSQLSELTNSDNTQTPEECVEMLQQNSYSVQTETCRRIQGALRRLISARYALKDRIPARIQMVASSQFTPTPDRLLPVFQWVQDLREENEQARIRWLYALQDTGSRLGDETGAFLRAFSEVTAQRVSLLPDAQGVTLSIPDSLWGQVSLRFSGMPKNELPESALFGYLFWIEADYTDSGYEFRLLLDTEFSDTLYQERLLQSRNWQEITLHCTEAKLHVQFCNYAARIDSYGFGGTDAALLGLCELLRKQTLLGTYPLSGPENHLTGVAQLLALLDLIPNALIPRSTRSPIDRLMENRYQITQTADILEQIDGNLGGALAELLRTALDAYENENFTQCHKLLDRFRRTFQNARQSGADIALAHSLMNILREGTADYHDAYPFENQYRDAQRRITDAAEPLLRKQQFSGTFPNYVRLRGHTAEYITFLTDGVPTASDDGFIHLHYSLAVARCRISPRFSEAKSSLPPYDQLNASAFNHMREHNARFALIYHPNQDGIRLSFSYRFLEQEQDDALRIQAAAQTVQGVQIVLCALDHRPLPHGYRPHARGQLHAVHAFSNLFNRTLPFGSPAAAAFLLFFYSRFSGHFRMLSAFGAALAAGLLVMLGITCIRYLRLRRTIWNR